MSSSNRDPFFPSSSSLGRRALGGSPSRLPPFPSSSSSLRRGVLGGSSFRHLPAPSSSVDHLEALLSGPSPSSPSSSSRASEKAQLQGLNDRFASYIEKVHLLEQQNQQLEAEAGALRGRLLSEPSRLQGLYQQELRELRAALEALRQDGDRAALEGQRMARDLQRLRQQEALQVQRSQEAQDQLRQARRQADQDTLRRMELEKKVEALLQEITFLRNLHRQEMEELQQELQQAQVPVEIDISKPDLTAALKEIRMQYEVLSARNQQSAEEWYKSKFANFTEEAARSSDSIRQAKEEISEYRRQLQARNSEIEALRSANESLERQLQEAEERGNGEIHGLQETISQLENALRTTKGEMARHLREYQDLLNVKMALDIEIAAYRKLLEGEETRLSNVGSSSSSSSSFLGFSYPFSSSPLSSLKGFSRSTVVARKEDMEDNPKEAEEEDSGDEK